MSALIAAFLTLAVFLTSLLSGIFGMAGGLILMVILLGLMPVAAAMSVHAAIQLVSNGWRCFLWRRHIVWHVLPWYGCGIVIGFTLMLLIHFVPDKAVTLMLMGSLPLLAMAGNRIFHLSVTRPAHTLVTATILTFIHLTAGVVGPLLDLLYNNAPLTRQQIISTKAFTQSVMHLVRLAYFGALIPLVTGQGGWPDSLDLAFLPVLLIASICGTSAAAYAVNRMTDRNFKLYSRILITIISAYCIFSGVSLYLQNLPQPL